MPASEKRTKMLVIRLSAAEYAIILKYFGPKKQVSGNIRLILTDPTVRQNPNEWRMFLRTYGQIKRILLKRLNAVECHNAEDLCDFISAICESRKLLEALKKNAP